MIRGNRPERFWAIIVSPHRAIRNSDWSCGTLAAFCIELELGDPFFVGSDSLRHAPASLCKSVVDLVPQNSAYGEVACGGWHRYQMGQPPTPPLTTHSSHPPPLDRGPMLVHNPDLKTSYSMPLHGLVWLKTMCIASHVPAQQNRSPTNSCVLGIHSCRKGGRSLDMLESRRFTIGVEMITCREYCFVQLIIELHRITVHLFFCFARFPFRL